MTSYIAFLEIGSSVLSSLAACVCGYCVVQKPLGKVG